jgi:NAD(P)-dependent dehydrogenase (short-subunit alcohol dehydrogenase family)
MGIEQKVVIITGASQGIGAALVSAYLDRNYRVVATSRSIKPSNDPNVLTVAGDIGDPETSRRIVAEALARFGRIDTLVNNAGIFVAAPFTDHSAEQYAQVVATNINGFFFMTQAAVVAQGWEAGGHRGVFDPDAPDERLGTLALTRLLVHEIDLPVIAAGGIMDGAGIAAALKLGASAAQLGTAFIACDESLADQGYRAALASDAAHHTVMTRAISGRPARGLANRFTVLGERIAPRDIPAYPIAYELGKALHAAGTARGEFGFGAQWAGQGAPLARAMPAARLVELLADELERAL